MQMDPKEKALLEEVVELSRENNKMLKKMHRSMRVSKIFRVIYWIIIIGSMLGLYYYLQPFLDNLKEAYNGIFSMFGKDGGAASSVSIPSVDSLLKR